MVGVTKKMMISSTECVIYKYKYTNMYILMIEKIEWKMSYYKMLYMFMNEAVYLIGNTM